jgi:hypothetical protein
LSLLCRDFFTLVVGAALRKTAVDSDSLPDDSSSFVPAISGFNIGGFFRGRPRFILHGSLPKPMSRGGVAGVMPPPMAAAAVSVVKQLLPLASATTGAGERERGCENIDSTV